MTTALLDGDILAFRAAAGACKTFDFGDGMVSSAPGTDLAIAAALETVECWRCIAKCRDVRVFFTGPRNFRKTVLPSYKAHRTQGKPPAYFDTVQAVRERFPTDTVDGLEADDLLGILATTEKYADNVIIVTVDKDLRTIPGRHINPTKDTKPVRVTLNEGHYKWLTQTLTGDATDGYKGIPGIGEKKALAILGGSPDVPLEVLWGRVLAAYKSRKLTEDDALTQARVARILHRSDYDRTTKEVLLWHPQSPVRLALSPSIPADPAAGSLPSPK